MPGQYTSKNRISLIHSGDDYFSLLIKLIENATQTIHLQVYIYDNDETGRQVGDALKAAVKKGVAVYLHVDGYASQRLNKAFKKDMIEAGVHFKFFAPIFKSQHFYFGRRLHHKVFVVDGMYSLVGGLNISNRYHKMPDEQPWFDVALYSEGEISYQLHLICVKMWQKRKRIKDIIKKKEVEVFSNSIPREERVMVRVRRNDWVTRKSEVWNTFRLLFAKSEKRITIISSYFLPGRTFRKLLSKAAARGVKVKVILAGKSDVALSKNAERYLYDYLLRKKIEIYEYEKTVLHAKMSVCDGEFVTIGSFNVNNISAYASLELNLDVMNKDFGAFVQDEMDKIIANDCKQVTEENHRSSTNIFRRLWQKMSYTLVNWILTLFTFYFKQEE